MRSVEAYELVKNAGEREGKGVGGGEGGGIMGRGGEGTYVYEVVSAHPPPQPVAAGERVYEHIS